MARTTGSEGVKTEAAIRKAAVSLIAARGYAAMTLRDLAREVGIQAGSLYRYYPSKQALLSAVMVTHLEELLQRWEAERPKQDEPRARLEAFIAFHVRFHARRQEDVFIAGMELRSLTPENHEKVAALRGRYEAILRRILRDGVDAGIFKFQDIQVATFAILAMLTGLTAWYREGGRLSQDELVRCYQDLVSGGVHAR